MEVIKNVTSTDAWEDVLPNFKTVECRIMDLADDIAYTAHDLEDCLKSGFITVEDLAFPPKEVIASMSFPKDLIIEELRLIVDMFAKKASTPYHLFARLSH